MKPFVLVPLHARVLERKENICRIVGMQREAMQVAVICIEITFEWVSQHFIRPAPTSDLLFFAAEALKHKIIVFISSKGIFKAIMLRFALSFNWITRFNDTVEKTVTFFCYLFVFHYSVVCKCDYLCMKLQHLVKFQVFFNPNNY